MDFTTLPDDLMWAQEQIQAVVKPAGFLRPKSNAIASQGSTRAWGLPDLPIGAGWVVAPTGERHWNRMPWSFNQSPYDGPSFYLQLNLAEIPDQVRKPEWPTVGVVWVFIDLSDDKSGWQADAYFDPRPAQDIPWHPRLEGKAPQAAEWLLSDMPPDCTEELLPQLQWAAKSYDEWVTEQLEQACKSDIQVGGWVWPCQGWFDERNKDFVCGLTRQHFGDSGAIYLHYSTQRGFYALVETH